MWLWTRRLLQYDIPLPPSLVLRAASARGHVSLGWMRLGLSSSGSEYFHLIERLQTYLSCAETACLQPEGISIGLAELRARQLAIHSTHLSALCARVLSLDGKLEIV